MTAADTPRRSQWGTIHDAAGLMACSPKTIRRMIADGKIEAVRVSSQLLRVNLDSITAKLERVGGVR